MMLNIVQGLVLVVVLWLAMEGTWSIASRQRWWPRRWPRRSAVKDKDA